MRNPENFREIRSKKKDIEDAFGRFIQSNEEYYQLVAEPETKAGGGHWSLLETAKPQKKSSKPKKLKKPKTACKTVKTNTFSDPSY